MLVRLRDQKALAFLARREEPAFFDEDGVCAESGSTHSQSDPLQKWGCRNRQPLTPLVTNLFIVHHITYAPDIFYISRLFGIFLDFFPEMEYMYHDSILIVAVDHPVDCSAQILL